MIAVVQRDEFDLVGLSFEFPVLSRDLQCAFHCIGATQAKRCLDHAFLGGHFRQLLRQCNGRCVGAAREQRIVGQLLHLPGHCVNDFATTIPGIDAPQPTLTVDETAPVDVGNVYALTGLDNQRPVFMQCFRILHRVHQVHGVVFFEPGIVVTVHAATPGHSFGRGHTAVCVP
ncbi:hypothetical protein D3C71_1471360 [compost metagenome]